MTDDVSHFTVPVPAGYRVGGWEVREPLASGAFGSVYAARAVDGSGEAALKFLPTGTRTPRQLRHLEDLAHRELELHRKLQRPRLIRMYEALTVDDPGRPSLDGATVLVLERAEGSLDTLLSRSTPGPLPSGPALLTQICEGLAQLHHAGWVHGDLKPGNVLLMADDTVRLGDFNLAAEMEGTHAYSPAFSTPDYTPPELLWSEISDRGQQIRPTADIWAFGVVAHLVLTGSMPVPGGGPAARREALLRYAGGTDELRLSPELPEPWREIVADCLARTHRERAVHDAASLLRRVEAAAGADRSPKLPRLRPRRWRGRRPLLIGTAAVTAMTAAVGAGLFALTRDTPTASGGYERCARGDVCFFSEENGRGEMCHWDADEPDWQSGSIVCEWGRTTGPKSVFNNGYTDGEPFHDIVYYLETDYRVPVGCVPANEKKNLFGGYAVIRSAEWRTNCNPYEVRGTP